MILIIYSLFLSFFKISCKTTLAIVGGYMIGQAIFATMSLAGDICKVTRGLLQLGLEQVVPIYSNQRVAYHSVCSIRPKVSSVSNRQETMYEARFGAISGASQSDINPIPTPFIKAAVEIGRKEKQLVQSKYHGRKCKIWNMYIHDWK